MNGDRLKTVLRLIDRANAGDPNSTEVERGSDRPAELVYGQRMSRNLERFCGQASEHLRIAARAQHIERWKSPRNSYPQGRVGYLKWRKDLKDYHARRAGELMLEAGYEREDAKRVGALIRKERLKHDEEAQALEDVACLVFLEHYAAEFIAEHSDDKVIAILGKTAGKMSAAGLAATTRLGLPERLSRLLHEALETAKEN